MSGEEGNIKRVSQRVTKGQIPVKFGEFIVDMPVHHSPTHIISQFLLSEVVFLEAPRK